MTYSYQCKSCDHQFDKRLLMDNRDDPLDEPCPNCKKTGEVVRCFNTLFISYEGGKTIAQRAGSGWNDVLTKVNDGAGRKSKIEVN